MVVKREGSKTVVEAALVRIKNAFSNGKKVYISFSGGKDSLCLLDLVLKLAERGEINPAQMIVEFIDEEAMYECVIQKVHEWRKKVLLAGGQFNWFCLEVKHFSCFNYLEEAETYICWDSRCKDVWVRKPPSFAIRKHPLLKPQIHAYQDFLIRHNSDGICITGVRMAESLQRSKYMTSTFSSKTGLARGNMVWAIYDWKDSDVWRYLYENQIDIPIVYLYMYQVGTRINQLRVSQFFSADTAKSLVKMNEFYPDLMDRIIKREPNAYLAALYYDSEMFKRTTKTRRELEEPRDYKAELFKMLKNPKKSFPTQGSLKNARRMIQILYKYGPIIEKRVYKLIYDCLVAGDPKGRTMRAIITTITMMYSQKHERRNKNAK